MSSQLPQHNRFKNSLSDFIQNDPHLTRLAKMKLKHPLDWWQQLSLDAPGIYILTGGRQVGKSTSCKLLIQHSLENNLLPASHIFYLACDQIFDAKELSSVLRDLLDNIIDDRFLVIIDEITFVKDWDRVIKGLADAGYFHQGICLLTGSDTLILKEAAMSFPGRRGDANIVDFHLHPLSFSEYVKLRDDSNDVSNERLKELFNDYLQCGGYLRAINDLELQGKVSDATFKTYEQWIRGDFLKRGKNEEYLLSVLSALATIGVSTVSYSTISAKIGLMKKDTCIDYIRLLERMDVLFNLQAFDQNKKQGFPRKDRKFHFFDPFIFRTVHDWLKREGFINSEVSESTLVEACVASHCYRLSKTFYFKGQGEIDVIRYTDSGYQAVEVKWANQIKPSDLKMLKQFNNAMIVTKNTSGKIDDIISIPVSQFLYEIG